MPKCLAEYLVLFFYEMGICSQSVNGATTITWQELDSWVRATQRKLSPWEIVTLRDMSKAYVGEYHAACEDKMRPMPYVENTEEAKVKNDDRLENFFEMMMDKD